MDEQDKERGLYPRYHITKANGDAVDPNAEYFVLRLDEEGGDPEHVQACRAAVITYAKRIKNFIPKLYKDLMERYDHWGNYKRPPDFKPDKFIYLETFVDDAGMLNVRDTVSKRPIGALLAVNSDVALDDYQSIKLSCIDKGYKPETRVREHEQKAE